MDDIAFNVVATVVSVVVVVVGVAVIAANNKSDQKRDEEIVIRAQPPGLIQISNFGKQGLTLISESRGTLSYFLGER